MTDLPASQPTWLGTNSFVAPRIDDEFYQKLIVMHRNRAQIYLNVSYVLLTATILLIGVGIYFFLKGDSEAKKILAEQEIKVATELNERRRELADLDATSAAIREKASQLERASVLSTCLDWIPTNVSLCNEVGKWKNVDDLDEAVKVGRRIADAIATLPTIGERDVEIDVSLFAPDDSRRFPATAIRRLKSAITENVGLSVADFQDQLRLIDEEVKTFLQQKPAMGAGDLPEELRKRVAALAETDDGFERLRKIKPVVDDQRRTAQVDQLADDANAATQQKKKRAVQERIDVLQKEMQDYDLQRNKILFMAWLPDLTVRAGAVVLLLFLTRILLTTYRYTVGLATFYMARSDVIQMLQPGKENTSWYQPEQLKILVECMSPDSLKVEPITDPTEYVTRLAEMWFTKGK